MQTTSRTHHGWPEVWTKIGKAAQNRENQEWAKERSKFDNPRRLRRIYFIDPDCEEKIEKTTDTHHPLQLPIEHHESGCKAGNCIRSEFENKVLLCNENS